ncbi:MAG: 3-oxoacyl-[acyl-carrier-protein] reductase [Gammaproteobacteria bacterium RIFCSPHIGHO2_02_FULL_39_13]|nr:MAG: 3-oxoacyl-[acyl-carrier-protein] reductase [Gammaproteobacteria bacterium RIFCSPHIGHO2_02_FULL_39_13]OGT48755.1 MAG: 3-oxoacyl-[acyl-carrier-protein] reductase [Gammaproteobacteria bacterium RIFCSPHIGHO2_12_FULL_39_24]
MSFKNKVVFITGASRGIGYAIAKTFYEQDATVIGTATTEAGAKNIPGHGIILNVCDALAVEKAFEAIQSTFGAPAILINNAGITEDNLTVRMKPEQWDRVIDTNLNAVYRTTKACLRHMMKARWGRIINITSVVAVTGNPGQANYCAAKAGMIGFTKAVAAEMASVGITVNAIAPGFIQTDMTDKLDEKQQEAILSQIPAKKMGDVSDITHAVLFLASDASAYITGQTLHINGGMYMA